MELGSGGRIHPEEKKAHFAEGDEEQKPANWQDKGSTWNSVSMKKIHSQKEDNNRPASRGQGGAIAPVPEGDEEHGHSKPLAGAQNQTDLPPPVQRHAGGGHGGMLVLFAALIGWTPYQTRILKRDWPWLVLIPLALFIIIAALAAWGVDRSAEVERERLVTEANAAIEKTMKDINGTFRAMTHFHRQLSDLALKMAVGEWYRRKADELTARGLDPWRMPASSDPVGGTWLLSRENIPKAGMLDFTKLMVQSREVVPNDFIGMQVAPQGIVDPTKTFVPMVYLNNRTLDIVNLKQASGGDLDFFNDPLYKDQAAVLRKLYLLAPNNATQSSSDCNYDLDAYSGYYCYTTWKPQASRYTGRQPVIMFMTSIYFFDMRSDEGFYSPKPASNCTSSSCFLPNGPPFNPKLGTKWWGFVASYYVMPETPDSSAAVVTSDKGDQVQVPSALSGIFVWLANGGYRYVVVISYVTDCEIKCNESNDCNVVTCETEEVVFFQSYRGLPRSDKVEATIDTASFTWIVALSRDRSFTPTWRVPLMIAVVIGALIVCVLLFIIFLKRKEAMYLLETMMPAKAIACLRSGKRFAEPLEAVAVLFSDIVSYTTLSANMDPMDVVEMLNALFSQFDALAAQLGVYKLDIVGDGYIVVAGAPDQEDPLQAASRIVRMGLGMIKIANEIEVDGMRIRIRVGIHMGPAVAAVVGRRVPRYTLFGDTVNTASRLESSGEAMRVHVSDVTATVLSNAPPGQFRIIPRGEVALKGKGMMSTYFVEDISGGKHAHGGSGMDGPQLSQPSLPAMSQPSLPFMQGPGKASTNEDGERHSLIKVNGAVMNLGSGGFAPASAGGGGSTRGASAPGAATPPTSKPQSPPQAQASAMSGAVPGQVLELTAAGLVPAGTPPRSSHGGMPGVAGGQAGAV